MRKLLVGLLMVASLSVFANDYNDVEMSIESVDKIDRNSVRSCNNYAWEKVCIDGRVEKYMCQIMINGVILKAGKYGDLKAFVAQSVGLVVQDILCYDSNTPKCMDFHVCKDWRL